MRAEDLAGDGDITTGRTAKVAIAAYRKIRDAGPDGAFAVTPRQLEILHDCLDGDDPVEREADLVLRHARGLADQGVPRKERIREAQEFFDGLGRVAP